MWDTRFDRAWDTRSLQSVPCILRPHDGIVYFDLESITKNIFIYIYLTRILKTIVYYKVYAVDYLSIVV